VAAQNTEGLKARADLLGNGLQRFQPLAAGQHRRLLRLRRASRSPASARRRVASGSADEENLLTIPGDMFARARSASCGSPSPM
jgi:hypothetical protein